MAARAGPFVIDARTGPAVELEIDGLATGGEGVGRDPDGRVTFIPLTAPGDRVRAELVQERRSWARGRLLEVMHPGPGRRRPPCPLFGRCGGCRLQHVEPALQRAGKREIVEQTLRRIGRVAAAVEPVVPAGRELGWRNRITLTLRRSEQMVVAGYHALGRPDEILDVDDCPLAEPAVRRAWRGLRAGWGEAAAALPSGPELRLTLRGSVSGGVALRIEGGERAAAPGRIMEAVPALESCVWEPDAGAPVTLAGEARFVDRWQGVRFTMGPGVFLQANRAASSAMDGAIDAALGRMTGRRIVDLYAGVAARAIRWARQGARVEAVELDAAACRAAREAAGQVNARVEVIEGSAEREAERTREADVIVANPPRTGLSGPVRAALAASGASRLVYVSCDPATLARDLESIAERWVVERVLPFDAFPQTGHVEAVTWLRPAVEAA